MLRLRIKYHKTGRIRLVSHLEMVRLVERIFRRMELPLTFTQGFNPHPKLSFASPLSVGIESVTEYLDVELDEKIDEKEILKRAAETLPEGLKFETVYYTEDKRALMSLVAWADYRVELAAMALDKQELEKAVKELLNKPEIMAEKKSGKKKGTLYNVRPQIKQLNVLSVDDGIKLAMTLQSGNTGSLKPEVVIEALGEQIAQKECVVNRVVRTQLYAEEGGRLVPLSELGNGDCF